MFVNFSMIRYLFILFLTLSCSGTIITLNELSSNSIIEQQIEDKGVYILNSYKVVDIYYLYNVDVPNGKVKVAYFIVWSDEFPDFGLKYKTTIFDILKQLCVPIIYTNWFYMPYSGGLQKIIYGEKDVEGIYVEYGLKNSELGNLINLTYESIGHIPNHISDKEKLRLEYSNNTAPLLEVSSWNHRFKKAQNNDDLYIVKFIPELFNNNMWMELEMNNRRAEKIKKMLVK